LIEKILDREEYNLLLAGEGSELFRILETAKPDLILLDVMMPGIDGYEVCQRLKADPKTTDIPVMFLTVLTHPNDVKRALTLGASAYLTKPFDPSDLDKEIRTVLQKQKN
jgi:CheY-like chemotaxis protein